MTVDEALGYPKAYADLCRNIDEDNHRPHRVSNSKANHLNKIFPVLPTAEDNTTAVAGEIDPNGFLNHLWKKLGHLGNAGFDPGLFRIDPYGNVLYFHSDRASPLFYHVDHWFPISRKAIFVNSLLVCGSEFIFIPSQVEGELFRRTSEWFSGRYRW